MLGAASVSVSPSPYRIYECKQTARFDMHQKQGGGHTTATRSCAVFVECIYLFVIR